MRWVDHLLINISPVFNTNHVLRRCIMEVHSYTQFPTQPQPCAPTLPALHFFFLSEPNHFAFTFLRQYTTNPDAYTRTHTHTYTHSGDCSSTWRELFPLLSEQLHNSTSDTIMYPACLVWCVCVLIFLFKGDACSQEFSHC